MKWSMIEAEQAELSFGLGGGSQAVAAAPAIAADHVVPEPKPRSVLLS